MERIEIRFPGRRLLCEPYLIAAEQIISQQRDIMRRKHELRALGVHLRVVERLDETLGEHGVQTGTHVVDEREMSIAEGDTYWRKYL